MAIPYWIQCLLEEAKKSISNPEVQKQIREIILDPFWDTIMIKLFPYMIGFLIVFIGTFLLAICAVIILIKIIYERNRDLF